MPAWKFSLLKLTPEGVRFRSLAFTKHTYGADATAECLKNSMWAAWGVGDEEEPPAHPAPDEDCACGFYGLADKGGAYNLQSPFHLQVEFSGTTIACALGYRAARQRVLGVQVNRVCNVVTWETDAGSGRSRKVECLNVPERLAVVADHILMPWCDDHIQGHGLPEPTPRESLTLRQVADQLGTEVLWAPA